MKKTLTSVLLFVGVSLFAQSATTATTTSKTTVNTQLAPKAKSLCKTWNLSQTENFGDVHKPTEIQKNDLLLLMEGGRYRLIMEGVAEGGTWTLSKDNLWITLTTDAATVKKFKVLESSETILKVDYRDADEVHNVLYYSTAAPEGKAK